MEGREKRGGRGFWGSMHGPRGKSTVVLLEILV